MSEININILDVGYYILYKTCSCHSTKVTFDVMEIFEFIHIHNEI